MAKKKVAKTDSQSLRPDVKKVLLAASKKANKPYLSAFQILDLLEPPSVRDNLYGSQKITARDERHEICANPKP